MNTPKTINTEPLNRLPLWSFKGIQMRTFHTTWFMFFVCFFGWFGLAPLMPSIRSDLHLTKDQVGNLIIISVSSTIIARLIIGRLCDLWGPRKTAIRLLITGSLPVMLVGLSKDYTSLLIFRGAIGIIGASFVITQYHCATMFGDKIKGTANAIAGGWGNLGGGVTNMVMPIIFTAIIGFGYSPHYAWRYAMIVPGVLMWLSAWLYYKFTKDTPKGNFDETGWLYKRPTKTDWRILLDPRILALTLAYAMSFGVEITFDNVASLHFVDNFHVSLAKAGILAGLFGLMNLFARAIGGYVADKAGIKYGLKGKGGLLAVFLLLEAIGLLLFAKSNDLTVAICMMFVFALFLKMANGTNYSIVPFINQKNLGLVSGVVGAGGNLGGMIFGFLFKSENISYAQAFTYIAYIVLFISFIIFITNFQKEPNRVEVEEFSESEVFLID